jgi:putative spermidine/putrescine transport system substrate-binding protein
MAKNNKMAKAGASRRDVLKGTALAAAAIAVPTVLTPRRTRAAVTLTVRDPGGPYVKAFGEGFYKAFNKANAGEIEVVGVAGKHEPTSQVKAMVDTGSYTWDAAILSISAVNLLVNEGDGYLEKLDLGGNADHDEIPAQFKTPYMQGNDVYATVLAYRNDVYKTKATAPVNGWKDVWDLEGIKGRRAIRKHPFDTFEEALMAQGVAPTDVYNDMRTNGYDPVFASLDKIKPAIDIWWTGGAQTSQLLTTGEVDICPTWNGRAQAAIDGGAPVTISWTQGLYSYEGWSVLKGGPNVEAARKFVAFCANAKNQAEFAKYLGYGPVNPNAYDHIAPARAAILPTSPGNLEQMTPIDSDFWGKEKDRATELFNGWLLG